MPTSSISARHYFMLPALLATCSLLAFVSAADAQDITATVAPNMGGSDNFVDIRNTTVGRWHFYTNPAPAAARMARVNSAGTSQTIWPSSPNFAPDANEVQNRIFPNEFLRVFPKTLAAGTLIQIEYSNGPGATIFHL